MLPAPDAARVFAFLGIAFSSCICYDWRAVGYISLLPPITVLGAGTPGTVFYLCAGLDLFGSVDAFDKFFGALNGVSPDVVFSRNDFCRVALNQKPILGL